MTDSFDPPSSRRQFLKLSASLSSMLGGLSPSIARALDIPAHNRTGTIKDVEHVVILMQENRSFDHYFGTLNGVRGFGDRFAIPVADTETRKGATVFVQPREDAPEKLIAPFAVSTTKDFSLMRIEGTPHHFKDAQPAWDHGRMGDWPKHKKNHAMGYYSREDMPFQFALAGAFTLCDAYHCSMHSGTNPNRTFHWTGTNVGQNGPVIDNGYDELKSDPKKHGGYDWTTYPERLSAAGINWQVYQNMKDNFTDNPLVGFKTYRAADHATSEKLTDLAKRSIRTRDLDQLKEDVLAGKLPQVSWIVGTAEGSEHPGPSSPAQGADYTAKVLDALTANPDVWSKTVFLINFDENDGYFDHVAPPAPPSLDAAGKPVGATDFDATAEYHQGDDAFKNRPYGLGPRVPMYVISPWSKGGYVASEVFDHTSVIRFLETRFGVKEPNISPWRRAVCGDLTSCFDFKTPNDQPFFAHLPKTSPLADQARALKGRTTPKTPDELKAPVQEKGVRPKRPTPYDLDCGVSPDRSLHMLNNSWGGRGVVFHISDLNDLNAIPHRYSVNNAQKHVLKDGPIDLWVNGPDGFHRRFQGTEVLFECSFGPEGFMLKNVTAKPLKLLLSDEAYGQGSYEISLAPNALKLLVDKDNVKSFNVQGWYDFSVSTKGYSVRMAGHSAFAKFTDPAAFGPAPLNV